MSDLQPTRRADDRSATRRAVLVGGAASLAAFALTPTSGAAAAARKAPAYLRGSASLTVDNRRMRTWAADTWRSLVAMTDRGTGLPSDNIRESLSAADRSAYTSPTNIGGYLWSTIVARELGIISRGEASARLIRTLKTVERMKHHVPSGMYYNWYTPSTGAVITVWPSSADRVYPFVSSVDNGWLGAALLVVMNSDRAASHWAARIFDRMRWDMFYDTNVGLKPGLIHGGFYDAPPPTGFSGFTGNHIGIGPDVWYTNHHYDTTVSETRITSYLGILTGQIPDAQYFAMWRTFPATCDWSWQEMQPVGVTHTYYGVSVYEGAYTYRGMHIVPGWGGSMFEELMPDMFVPEATWAPNSWGRNHPLHVRAQREHGLIDAGYGVWGFSPSSDPYVVDGYREYGVDALGLAPGDHVKDPGYGYFSDEQMTNYDVGFDGCRPATNPHPTYGDGIVTPHASFLAMMHEPAEAFANLVTIEQHLKAYGRGGFFDAVASSGKIARRYLSLDQAMVMGSIGNVLADDVIRRGFSTPAVEKALRPVIGIEEFGASPV
jgi:hypothetical protein